MSWILIALIGPILYAMSNFVDKFLIQTHFSKVGPGPLIMYGTLVAGLFILPIVAIAKGSSLFLPPNMTTVLLAVGVLHILGILLYYYALEREETSTVVPFFQLIPVCTFILGWFLLGEVLTRQEIIGASIVILGTLALSLEVRRKKLHMKVSIFILMILSSIFIALGSTLFKIGAGESGFWQSIFWTYTGALLLTLFFFALVPHYRQGLLSIMGARKKSILALNVGNELLDLGANLAIRFATLLAPLALVWTLAGLQPVFVFVGGLILTLLFPNIVQENLSKKHLVHKIISVAIICVGVYVLTF
jgi:uncharacterized membrane protein